MCYEAFHWQRKLRDPGLGGFVQNNAPSHTALQVVFFARCDIQIDPKSVWTHFKFLISTELRGIGLHENFRDVAVPELVAAAIGLGIRKNRDPAKPRVKSHKKELRPPQ